LAKGKKVAIGVGITMAVIFIALIVVGSAALATARSLDFTLSSPTITHSNIPTLAVTTTTTYMYDVDFVNNGGAKYLLAPTHFKMITNASSVHNGFPYLIGQQALAFTELEQDQHAKGQLGFTIPKGETPLQIEYWDGSIKIAKQVG
jgi:Domain of unknown function (DUF4352)